MRTTIDPATMSRTRRNAADALAVAEENAARVTTRRPLLGGGISREIARTTLGRVGNHEPTMRDLCAETVRLARQAVDGLDALVASHCERCETVGTTPCACYEDRRDADEDTSETLGLVSR